MAGRHTLSYKGIYVVVRGKKKAFDSGGQNINQQSQFLRQTFVEWAAKSIRFSFWARLYYEHQRDKGVSHQTAVRALAFKWIRIVFRCWQTRTPYDESVYLAALQRRKSSLISNFVQSSKKGENG